MRARVLLRDEKYRGQYVAMKSFDDSTVVASGRTAASALRKARAAGVEDPVLLYVPPKDMVLIY